MELALLRQELGIPAIYVTHDQAEALSMGDSMAVLAAGRILQQGSPEAIYRRPVSPVVARQLGQPAINILRVQRRGDAWVGESGERVMAASQGGWPDALGGAAGGCGRAWRGGARAGAVGGGRWCGVGCWW